MSELGPISGLNKQTSSPGSKKLNITLDSNEAIITAFNLTKDDTTSLFNAIKKLCVESGLSELKKPTTLDDLMITIGQEIHKQQNKPSNNQLPPNLRTLTQNTYAVIKAYRSLNKQGALFERFERTQRGSYTNHAYNNENRTTSNSKTATTWSSYLKDALAFDDGLLATGDQTPEPSKLGIPVTPYQTQKNLTFFAVQTHEAGLTPETIKNALSEPESPDTAPHRKTDMVKTKVNNWEQTIQNILQPSTTEPSIRPDQPKPNPIPTPPTKPTRNKYEAYGFKVNPNGYITFLPASKPLDQINKSLEAIGLKVTPENPNYQTQNFKLVHFVVTKPVNTTKLKSEEKKTRLLSYIKQLKSTKSAEKNKALENVRQFCWDQEISPNPNHPKGLGALANNEDVNRAIQETTYHDLNDIIQQGIFRLNRANTLIECLDLDKPMTDIQAFLKDNQSLHLTDFTSVHEAIKRYNQHHSTQIPTETAVETSDTSVEAPKKTGLERLHETQMPANDDAYKIQVFKPQDSPIPKSTNGKSTVKTHYHARVQDRIVECAAQDKIVIFQVASQTNGAEFPSNSDMSVVSHVAQYLNDHTQGPFAQLCNPELAQLMLEHAKTFNNPDGFDGFDGILDTNGSSQKNGYISTGNTSETQKAYAKKMKENWKKIQCKAALSVPVLGKVTGNGTGYEYSEGQGNVGLVYVSAIPVNSYGNQTHDQESIETIQAGALLAAYENTVRAGLAARDNATDKPLDIHLTRVGGGAFHNDQKIIDWAMQRTMDKYKDYNINFIIEEFSDGVPNEAEPLTPQNPTDHRTRALWHRLDTDFSIETTAQTTRRAFRIFHG